MAHDDEFLDLVDDPGHPVLEPGNPADAALLTLMAQVAVSDGTVDDRELAFLQRVLPNRDRAALKDWAIRAGGQAIDLRAFARALRTPEERWKGLRFAVRMAWKDGVLHDEERGFLGRLVEALELPDGSLERALNDISGRGAKVIQAKRITAAFHGIRWDSVDWAEGGLEDDLAAVVPKGATAVIRVGIDDVEALGLYQEGIAARFQEGAAWLPWNEIVTYTRGASLGVAVRLHTEESSWTLSDFRLAGVGLLLDRIYGASSRPSSPPPRVELLRGE